MAVLTEYDVKRRWKENPDFELIIEKGTILTPSARGFLQEKNINVCIEKEQSPLVEETVEIVVEPEEVLPVAINREEKALLLKWKMLQVDVFQGLTQLDSNQVKKYVKDIEEINQIISDVIESFQTGQRVFTSRINEDIDLLEIEFEPGMPEYIWPLYRLLLDIEALCNETNALFMNTLGQTTREDLLDVEIRLPFLMRQIIQD